MAIDGESIGAVPYGPNTDALLEALATTARVQNMQGAELLTALDITAPTWDPLRPAWHLPLIETFYIVRAEPTFAAELRYRVARARTFARHASGRLGDLIHVFSALIGVAGVDISRVRILTDPMVLTVIFSAEDAAALPPIDRVTEIARTSAQDVAGFSFLAAPAGVSLSALFTLDSGPAFDVGTLAVYLGP